MRLDMETQQVLVFKTTVSSVHEVEGLIHLLNKFGKWSFDLEDEDRILRIETFSSPQEIEGGLSMLGFGCSLMPY